MHELDGVLDRDDVVLPAAVDRVDHRRERRRLPRTGRAGDQHEPAMLVSQLFHALRQGELVEIWNLLGDEAKRDTDRAALPVTVDAEAPQTFGHVGRVELSVR